MDGFLGSSVKVRKRTGAAGTRRAAAAARRRRGCRYRETGAFLHLLIKQGGNRRPGGLHQGQKVRGEQGQGLGGEGPGGGGAAIGWFHHPISGLILADSASVLNTLQEVPGPPSSPSLSPTGSNRETGAFLSLHPHRAGEAVSLTRSWPRPSDHLSGAALVQGCTGSLVSPRAAAAEAAPAFVSGVL